MDILDDMGLSKLSTKDFLKVNYSFKLSKSDSKDIFNFTNDIYSNKKYSNKKMFYPSKNPGIFFKQHSCF